MFATVRSLVAGVVAGAGIIVAANAVDRDPTLVTKHVGGLHEADVHGAASAVATYAPLTLVGATVLSAVVGGFHVPVATGAAMLAALGAQFVMGGDRHSLSVAVTHVGAGAANAAAGASSAIDAVNPLREDRNPLWQIGHAFERVNERVKRSTHH